MRILLTTDTVGGVWTFTAELAEQLLLRGDAIALVSFGREASEAQRRWASGIKRNYGGRFVYRESDAPLEWMQNNRAAFAEGTAAIMKMVSDFRPELLHASQFCWGMLPLDIPKLITAHSDVMSWASACRPDVLNGSPWLERYCTLVQHGIDGADAVVAPTAWMRDALSSNFEVASLFTVIYNGRDIRQADRAGTRKLQAVSAGRLWDEAKGLATLLEVNAAMPIAIAGEDHFRDAASAATGKQRVSALGMLDEEELLKLFRESAVYVAPSIYEPFGLAPLEAAQCGCALVARDLPSLREVWGDAALYFHTTRELEQLLVRLASDADFLRQVQQRCRARALRFTARRMAEEYRSLYQSLLEANVVVPALPTSREFASHAA